MFTRLVVSSLLAFACTSSFAHDFSAGELQISHPWSREVPPNEATGAAYLVVHNQGATKDRLLSAQKPRATGVRLVTNSSAAVGWIPMVSSK